MLRRHSGRWATGIVAAVGIVFVPIAAGSTATDAARTLTLLALLLSVLALQATWLVVRQIRRANPSSLVLGVAALVGSLTTALFLDSIGDFAGLPRTPLVGRLFVSAVANGIGLWLFVISVRRVFPRRNRPLAVSAIALVAVGLFPGPALLLQPSIASLNISNVD